MDGQNFKFTGGNNIESKTSRNKDENSEIYWDKDNNDHNVDGSIGDQNNQRW